VAPQRISWGSDRAVRAMAPAPLPVAGKPFVLEDLCFGMGTSVASALTAETVFEL